jgi:hypothetical protein
VHAADDPFVRAGVVAAADIDPHHFRGGRGGREKQEQRRRARSSDPAYAGG